MFGRTAPHVGANDAAVNVTESMNMEAAPAIKCLVPIVVGTAAQPSEMPWISKSFLDPKVENSKEAILCWGCPEGPQNQDPNKWGQ